MFTERDVLRALDEEQFLPHFQPLIALRTGQLAGFEILARWEHPTAGMIPPDEFIPVAEANNWIGALTQQILRKAFACLTALPDSLTLAANISPLQLRDLSLPQQVLRAAEQSGFPLDRLMVEITESALADNLEEASAIAQEMKSMGCKLALDDFGTGYSSLLHLQSLPFDELKVDRSFVSSMMQRRESRKIVSAVVGMGQSLGLTTVAEGIESEDQAEALRWLGCDLGQGWLYGRPMAAEQLAEFIGRPRMAVNRSAWKPTSLDNLRGLPSQRLAQLQAVYDGAPVGLAFLDPQLRYVNLNQRLADMHHMPIEDHLGKSLSEVLPKKYKQLEVILRRALAGEAINDYEVIMGENPARTVLASYEPVKDEAGEIIGVSVAVVDITERTRTEQALRESEDHYRHMVVLNPQIPWIADANGQNSEISPKWSTLTGQSQQQSHGWGWMDVLHPDDKAKIQEIIKGSLCASKPLDLEFRVRHMDGQWRWMRSRGSPRFDGSGNIMSWYGSVEDIDEQKKMLENLRANEARLQAVFDSVPVGIILTDAPQPKLRLANPEARRMFPSPILPSPSMNDFSRWHAERANGQRLEAEEYPLARALRGERTEAESLFCKFADGTTRWIVLSGAPVIGANGEIVGGVTVAQDVDVSKRERQRLLHLAESIVNELKANG